MHDMTAAQLTFPMGSYVKVTNLRNGRAVVVRVNDRGPIVPGRIIDLSYGAAQALQMKRMGCNVYVWIWSKRPVLPRLPKQSRLTRRSHITIPL